MTASVCTYLLGLAFVLSLGLTPLARRLALHLGVLDLPGERKIHRVPKPRLGGLAIYTTVMGITLSHIALLLLLADHPLVSRYLPFLREQVPWLLQARWKLAAVLVGATVVMLVGVVDDARRAGLSPAAKLIGQCLAVTVVLAAGVRTNVFPSAMLNYTASALWILLITNAFNLLDNMDGLSAGVALLACLFLAVVTASQGQLFSAALLVVYAGALAGFLPYNFFPATLFMGDTGSLFIGYSLGCLTITSSYVIPASTSLLPVILPVLVLSVPLFDTFSTVLLRLRAGHPLFVGDTRHFSHRLLAIGMSRRKAVLFIYLVSACVGSAATLLPHLPAWGALVVLVQASIIYALITLLMIVGGQATTSRRRKVGTV